MAYFLMFFAIAMELTGTTFLKMSHGFTLILPTAGCLISMVSASSPSPGPSRP